MSTRTHKFGIQNQGGSAESDDESGYNYGNQESYYGSVGYANDDEDNEDEDDDYDDEDDDEDDDDDDDDDDESSSADEEKKDIKIQETPDSSKIKA